MSRALSGIDAVVHCAALLPDSPDAPPEAFQEVNVGGTSTVMREARAQWTKYVIAMSTISVVDHVTRKVGPSELLQ